MPTHIRINVGKPTRSRDHEHRESEGFKAWAAERTPKVEPPARSLSAGHRSDRWSQRAAGNSVGSDRARSAEQIAEVLKRRKVRPR